MIGTIAGVAWRVVTDRPLAGPWGYVDWLDVVCCVAIMQPFGGWQTDLFATLVIVGRGFARRRREMKTRGRR